MSEDSEIQAQPEQDYSDSEQCFAGKRQSIRTRAGLPKQRFCEHAGDQGERDAAEMIEWRKHSHESANNGQEYSEYNLAPELQSRQLHERRKTNCEDLNNQLTG